MLYWDRSENDAMDYIRSSNVVFNTRPELEFQGFMEKYLTPSEAWETWIWFLMIHGEFCTLEECM